MDGEVEALRAGRRDDVRGVAGEEQPAVLHRLDTNERIGVTLFSIAAPRPTRNAGRRARAKRASSSSQMRSSGQSSIRSSGATCRYSRDTVGDRIEYSANPRSCEQ